mmetsp:Transcript_33492/g.75707  ORF Transcript_33492/g.75707 Transcript_33492/m.75707 type:complete len:225 (+) Transcript_33492:94-768(+)
MWTSSPLSKALGRRAAITPANIMSHLVQPQLRNFVFKGLKMTKAEFVEGSSQAVAALLVGGEQSSFDVCDPTLSKVLKEEAGPIPILNAVDKADFSHLRLVVGGSRTTMASPERSKIQPSCVGDSLVIFTRQEDFRKIPEWVKNVFALHISETYCRDLIRRHGFSVQFAVDFQLDVSDRDAIESRKLSQQWVFESGLMDASFEKSPDWAIVDINGRQGGNEYWK